ncbi:MAG: Hpt domain-containing protein [Bacteroidales bacterium]|jgi:hypothetical protein|nr:Hpt domain-containing protein [Bacteroidales bacterium]
MSLNFKYIHTDYLIEISEQDPAFIDNIVSVFFRETPLLFDSLFAAAHKKNCEEVRKIRHTLRSSFAIIGVEDLCDGLCFIALESITSDTCSKIIDNREKINTQFNCICDELRTFTSNLR